MENQDCTGPLGLQAARPSRATDHGGPWAAGPSGCRAMAGCGLRAAGPAFSKTPLSRMAEQKDRSIVLLFFSNKNVFLMPINVLSLKFYNRRYLHFSFSFENRH